MKKLLFIPLTLLFFSCDESTCPEVVDECGVVNGNGYDCGGACGQFVQLWGECFNIQGTDELRSSDLNDGHLSGQSIPPEIGLLTNLELIILRGGLIGEIPSEIGNLVNLTHLDLEGNEGYCCGNILTGEIPSEIGNLVNLEYLDLNGNSISGEIPSEIGNLVNLDNLNLYGNDLSGAIPDEVCNLIENNNLALNYITSGNNFTSTCP